MLRASCYEHLHYEHPCYEHHVTSIKNKCSRNRSEVGRAHAAVHHFEALAGVSSGQENVNENENL